jgi:hypothetical protein
MMKSVFLHGRRCVARFLGSAISRKRVFSSSGVTTSIPLLWDPVFLAKKKATIAALGAHFTNNPTVTIVWTSFANATSEDWNVPHTPDFDSAMAEPRLHHGLDYIEIYQTDVVSLPAVITYAHTVLNGLQLDDAGVFQPGSTRDACAPQPARLRNGERLARFQIARLG